MLQESRGVAVKERKRATDTLGDKAADTEASLRTHGDVPASRVQLPVSAPLSRARRAWALFAILCMTFMETLDGTIVNVALPTMQRELGVGGTEIQLVSSVFLVVTCAFLLVFGRLGDMLGKVRVFQVGVVLFCAGSAACALSSTLSALVIARAIQALGVACSLANNQGIITELFAKTRGRALGLVATFTALGAMAGPTIGGMLVSLFPWESIFVINLPIGVISFVIGVVALPNRRPQRRVQFDVAGAVLIVPAILLIFAAITLMETAVEASSVGMLVAGAVLLGAFVVVERRQPEPLVHLEIFRNVSFDIDLAAMVLVFLGLSGVTIIMPFYLQDALGLEPGLAGLVMACYPLVNATIGTLSGALSDRIECIKPTLAGQVVFMLGILGLSTLALDTPIARIVPMLMFTSLGSAMFQSPNNSLIMGHAAPEMLGFVGSLGNLMRYFGQSLGTTISIGVLYGTMSAEAGTRVTSFVEGQPELFMHGLAMVFYLLAGLVAVALAMSLVRTLVLDRRKRRARA